MRAFPECDNNWVDTVRARVVYDQDLSTADAADYQMCNVNFTTRKQGILLFKYQNYSRPENVQKYRITTNIPGDS